MLPTIEWKDNKVVMIDQRKLPAEEVFVECLHYECVADAIEQMVIRGAPAIGVAAAYGVALGILDVFDKKSLDLDFERVTKRLERTRPTAVNLFWALDRMKRVFQDNRNLDLPALQARLVTEAQCIESEDIEINRRLGFNGKDLFGDEEKILTHCNAGALATAGYGTALGVIRALHESGRSIEVYADETRPFLQGARLTCWELHRDGIPVVLITDNMAGHLMKSGEITSVITGADRIARNGDTANKIGTYSVAVLAREHGIPFYIAAPMSTIDFSMDNGNGIPIEERDPEEVRRVGGHLITIENIDVKNPAFDVTPAGLIAAVITEKGVVRPPFSESLEALRIRK
ncbi:S-methyl-5-thioribose-1-phosphate isomerase [Acidobacteriota bacterium]